MTRFATFALFGIGVVAFVSSPIQADGPTKAIPDQIAVQTAILSAKNHLAREEVGQAVEVLEKHLDIIDGNPSYLRLLRQAYIPYITGLRLNGKHREAQIYMRRLEILDPNAAKQLQTNPNAGVTTARSQETSPEPKLTRLPTPTKMPSPEPEPEPSPVTPPTSPSEFRLPWLCAGE